MFSKIITLTMLALILTMVLPLAFFSRCVKAGSPPSTEWSKPYGGTNDDFGYSVVQTADGGYAMAGYTYSYGAGNSDFWLVKADSNGNAQWNHAYGGTDIEYAYSITQTSDGGYAIGGHTKSYGSGSGDLDVWLVKTFPNGNVQWANAYGGTGAQYGRSVIQTSDGGYAIAGFASAGGSNDFLLVKSDGNGNKQWSRTYGGNYDDRAYCVVQTSDGGYALAGYTESYGVGSWDFWLVKTDSSGVKQWDRTYGGANLECAYSVIQTRDGGYALAGETASHIYGKNEAWLVKTDAGGYMQWSQPYGMPVAIDISVYSLVQTIDGGYALGGQAWNLIIGDPNYGKSDFWLAKTYANGDLDWNQTYGGTGQEYAHSVVETNDGGYALAGQTNSFGSGAYDFWLVKVGSTLPPVFYDLTISVGAGGTTSPTPGSYQYVKGGVARVTALPQSQYGFDHWELDTVNVGSTNPYSVTMNSAHTLRAVFSNSPQRPIASFVYSPCDFSPVVGEEVWFDASQSKGATLYTWDFGDPWGPVSTVFDKTSYTFRTEGVRIVYLTVTNSLAQTDTYSKIVNIRKPPVLLVHGFHWGAWDLSAEWRDMKDSLDASGFGVYVSGYSPTDTGTKDHIQLYAFNLGIEVNHMRQLYGVDKVDIVAHSMGGLVSRWYVEMMGGDKYVRKLIMLETPNHGFALQTWKLIFFWAPPVWWHSANDMMAQSRFLQDLNRNYKGYHDHYDPAAYPWWDMSYPYNDVISPNVQYEILGGWLYSYLREVFDLDAIAVPTSNIFNDVWHGDLINHNHVIYRIIYLLNDDPEPSDANEENLPYQFASAISDEILPEEQQSFEISITSTSEASFVLNWLDGDLNLTLNTPNGTLIDPYAAETDPNVSCYQDENTEGYSIRNPESGVWRANVTAVNITEEEQYALTTLLNTTIRLTLDLQGSKYDVFEPILIRANLSCSNEYIPNGSAEAIILKSDNTQKT